MPPFLKTDKRLRWTSSWSTCFQPGSMWVFDLRTHQLGFAGPLIEKLIQYEAVHDIAGLM
jgi:hypothetical protein